MMLLVCVSKRLVSDKRLVFHIQLDTLQEKGKQREGRSGAKKSRPPKMRAPPGRHKRPEGRHAA